MPSTETLPLLRPPPTDNHRLGDVRILATSFFFLFASFSTIATLSSTVLPPTVSFAASGSLYFTYAMFNLFAASQITDRIGPRAALFISTLTYLCYNTANIVALGYPSYPGIQTWILVPAAILNGLGAAVLWTAQGLYVAKCASPQSLGRYSGIFFGFMWSSGVVGPLFSTILLNEKLDTVLVFQVLTAISGISLILMGYLWSFRPEPSNPHLATSSVGSPVEEENTYFSTVRLLVDPRMLLLMPLSYLIGFEQAFYGSSLPLFVRTANANADLSTKLYLRAALGVVITCTAFVVGGLTDRFGSRPMVVASLAIHIMCQTVLLQCSPLNNLTLLLFAYICIGVSNGILFNQAQKLVGTSFKPSQISQAYSAYKFHTSVGTAGCFFFSAMALRSDGLPNMWVWSPLFLVLASSTTICISIMARSSGDLRTV